jgi:hypothetical protein
MTFPVMVFPGGPSPGARPRQEETPPAGDRLQREEPPIGEKGLGKFTSRQPALEELVVQMYGELEEFPGGLLPRKTPGGELPSEKLLEF